MKDKNSKAEVRWAYKDEFGKRIEDRLTDLGKTPKEVCSAINMDQRTFGGYKNGFRIPRANVILDLAKELGCTTDYLLGGEIAESHDSTFVCEYTGLPKELVEYLHYKNGVEPGLEKAHYEQIKDHPKVKIVMHSDKDLDGIIRFFKWTVQRHKDNDSTDNSILNELYEEFLGIERDAKICSSPDYFANFGETRIQKLESLAREAKENNCSLISREEHMKYQKLRIIDIFTQILTEYTDSLIVKKEN